MSYTIEFERKVFVLPADGKIKAEFSQSDLLPKLQTYLLFVNEACSSITPIEKEWRLIAWGWNHEIIANVCERAAWTESGSLKLPTGNTTPEMYLQLHRKEIDCAEEFSIEAIHALTGIRSGYLCLGAKGQDDPEISALIDQMQEHFTPVGLYCDHMRYNIELSSKEQFLALVTYANLAHRTDGFIGVEVFHD
jgi:hypothetical protein